MPWKTPGVKQTSRCRVAHAVLLTAVDGWHGTGGTIIMEGCPGALNPSEGFRDVPRPVFRHDLEK